MKKQKRKTFIRNLALASSAATGRTAFIQLLIVLLPGSRDPNPAAVCGWGADDIPLHGGGCVKADSSSRVFVFTSLSLPLAMLFL